MNRNHSLTTGLCGLKAVEDKSTMRKLWQENLFPCQIQLLQDCYAAALALKQFAGNESEAKCCRIMFTILINVVDTARVYKLFLLSGIGYIRCSACSSVILLRFPLSSHS